MSRRPSLAQRVRGLQWPDLMALAIGMILAGAAWQQSGAIVGLLAFAVVVLMVLNLANLRELDRRTAQRDGAVQAHMRNAIRGGWWND